MQNLFSTIKSLNIFRVLTVFLAGVILFVSTACSSGGLQAKGLNLSNNPRPEVPDSAITNSYEGGMNDFSDVDPRFDTSRADAEAKDLVNRAKHNLQKSVDSPEQYTRNYKSGTPLGERVENLGEDISESTKELTKGFTKGTERGIENIKSNTQDAADDVADSAENTKDKAGYAAKDAKDSINNLFTNR